MGCRDFRAIMVGHQGHNGGEEERFQGRDFGEGDFREGDSRPVVVKKDEVEERGFEEAMIMFTMNIVRLIVMMGIMVVFFVKM